MSHDPLNMPYSKAVPFGSVIAAKMLKDRLHVENCSSSASAVLDVQSSSSSC